MKITSLALDGLLLIEPTVYGDARGYFLESYNARRYREAGVMDDFVQINRSRSRKGVLRGLHLQNPHAQAKLVSVIVGEVFDVAVDLRPGSRTFGQWIGERLSEENMRQLYLPAGFAHGFAVLSDEAIFSYACSEFYAPEAEIGVRFDDPDIGIDWPIERPILSEKDRAHPYLREIPLERFELKQGPGS